MLNHLFKNGRSIFPAKKAAFRGHVDSGNIDSVTLAGCQDKGFVVFGILNNSKDDSVCMLVNRNSEIRFIKSPDVAHSFLYKLGVKKFNIDTTDWDMESSFDPHKVSQECRERKKRRDFAQKNLPLYLDKFRSAYSNLDIEAGFELLVRYALSRRWLESHQTISKKQVFSWFDRNKNSHQVEVEKEVPEWVVMSAANLSTKKGSYPTNSLELSVFARLWQSSNGMFSEIETFFDSLPTDFITTIKGFGLTESCTRTAFNDEIISACNIKRTQYSG